MTRAIALIVVLLPASVPCAEAGGSWDRTQAGSYAFGADMGRSLREQGVRVDAALLARGLADGLAGVHAPLDDVELRRALAAFQGEIRARQELTRRRIAAANRAAGSAYLAANRERPGVVVLPSGLQYEVLAPGDGPTPAPGDTALCRYRTMLPDGTELESSSASPDGVPVVLASAIPAWREALARMPVGSRWRLSVPPHLGPAPRRDARGGGPDQTLVYELELVTIR